MGPRVKDLTGKKFNNLTVTKFIAVEKCGTKWELTCICGNKVVRLSSNFKKNHIHSCGCLSTNPGKKNAGFRRLYNDYRASARNRGYSFSLTKKEFKVLIEQNCSYCNNPPAERYKKQVAHVLLANGIDRVNNKFGYSIKNSVPCCVFCNKAKGTLNQVEFLNWVKKIYKHNFKEKT